MMRGSGLGGNKDGDDPLYEWIRLHADLESGKKGLGDRSDITQ
jgi:hypothetical protein